MVGYVELANIDMLHYVAYHRGAVCVIIGFNLSLIVLNDHKLWKMFL